VAAIARRPEHGVLGGETRDEIVRLGNAEIVVEVEIDHVVGRDMIRPGEFCDRHETGLLSVRRGVSRSGCAPALYLNRLVHFTQADKYNLRGSGALRSCAAPAPR
jgi:hypothetical protein